MRSGRASRYAASSARTSSGRRDRREASRCSLLPARERSHEHLEVVAAFLEVPVLIEARAGGREQYDLTRGRTERRLCDGMLEVSAFEQLDAARSELVGDPRRGLADQVAALAVLGNRGDERLEPAAFQRATEDHVHAAAERAQGRDRRGGVRRL